MLGLHQNIQIITTSSFRRGGTTLETAMRTIFAILVLSLAGCSIEGILAPVGDWDSQLPISNGFQVNNVSSFLEGEAWINGNLLKASVGPKKSARFRVTFPETARRVSATLTVTVSYPGGAAVTVYQVERVFNPRYPTVIAVTVEDYEGGPAVFVHEGNRKIPVPPVN